MALTLTIEDGSLVSNANSFVSVAEIIAYNVQRGTDMSDEDADDVVTWATQALDYLQGYEARFRGNRVSPSQSLAWPRRGVKLYNTLFDMTSIPRCVRDAQCYLTGVVFNGTDLYAVQSTRAITKEVIGPLETDYSSNNGATVRPMIPNVDAMLHPVLRTTVGMLTAVRV